MNKFKVFFKRLKFFMNIFNKYIPNNNPLISVVIPIYDRENELKESINSVLSQSYKNFELLLICDGSPQNTLDIVESYRSHKKVKIIKYDDNSGNAVRGRNRAILESCGEYLAFMDSDDIALPDRLFNSLKYIRKYNADIVYGGWEALVVDRNVDLINGQKVYSPDCDLEMLQKVCVPCQSTVMVKLSALRQVGGLKKKMRYREDHELWVRLAFYGYKFKSIPKILVKLRLHANNLELKYKNDDYNWEELLLCIYKEKGDLT